MIARRWLPVLLAVLALSAAACGGERTFRAREAIRAPEASVDATPLPVLLQWTATDGLAEPTDNRYFVVFVDRPPVAPGTSIAAAVDVDCDDEDCTSQDAFAEAGVFVTRESRLLLMRLRDRRTSPRDGAPDHHVATVVMADGDGVRIGDVAASIPFAVDREGL